MSSDVAVRFESVSKSYRVGGQGAWSGDLRNDLAHWWASVRGRESAIPQRHALRGVGFEVGAGEAVALIGGNGAGKSTILKLVARITRPTSGELAVRGRVAALIQVGAGFHRELSGRENLYLYGAILGLSRAELDDRYEEIVGFAGLSDAMDLPVKKYSHGMFLRLGFSVAAHVDPDILLVDEVLAVGDAEFRKRCLERMDRFRADGATLLFVTHERDLSERVCDRAILLESGRVQSDGPVSSVWDEHEGASLRLRASS